MITAVKVHFHCLKRLFSKKRHLVCWIKEGGQPRKWFCSCGYMNNGVTWNDTFGKFFD